MARRTGIGLLITLVLGMAPASHAVAASGWLNRTTSITAGFQADDNITRAERDFDILDDTILSLEGDIANAYSLNENSLLRLRGHVSVNRYQDFDKLSNNRAGFTFGYHLKPDLHFTGIEYFLRAAYEVRDYDDNRRDGNATNISLGIRKRLTDILSMRLAYVNESVDAEVAMYETDGNRVYLDLDYVLSGVDKLYLTLSRYDGDVLSTINPVIPNPKFNNIPFVIDTAYPRPSASLWWWTYRLDATTNAVRLGGVYALDHSQGLDFSVYYYDTEAAGYNNYDGLIYSLYYSYSF